VLTALSRRRHTGTSDSAPRTYLVFSELLMEEPE